jgi:hypothetical protein
MALAQWSERWSPPEAGPVATVTEKASGRPARVVFTSDPYVTELSLREVEIAPGPGAHRID